MAATVRTVTQVIQTALRRLAVLAATETVDSADTATGLIIFQDLIAELSGENLIIPYESDESITLVADQGSYTIGENGTPDKSTPRPLRINSAYITDSGSINYAVEVITKAQYDNIPDKTQTGRPFYLYYNPTVPNGTIYLYYVPDAAETLHIIGYKPLTDPAQLSDDLEITTGIPRMYHNPLGWMLAEQLAPEYGIEPSLYIQRRAIEGKALIQSVNSANRLTPAALEVQTAAPGKPRRTILSM